MARLEEALTLTLSQRERGITALLHPLPLGEGRVREDNWLAIADVMHERQLPKRHKFNYTIYYLAFPLSKKPLLARAFLSINKFNLLSFYDKDHGARDGSNIEAWIKNLLAGEGINADGEIVLMTFPRVLGYVFNPVSFWFCLDKSGNLRAVLAEVSNTFGEHHNYLLSLPENQPITPDDWLEAEKVFHVSPFLNVEGKYRFRFYYSEKKIAAWIDHETADSGTGAGNILKTSVIARRRPLTNLNIIKVFFRYPLVTLVSISHIHLQAVRLYFKGATFFKKPLPPIKGLTRNKE